MTVQTLHTDGAIEIHVTDTGVGFEEELATCLFEPFMTTRKEGIGLGLPICRTIVEAHGGEILADSAPGHGATFRVTLPIERRSRERLYSPASPRRKAYHVVGGGPEHDAAPHFKRFSLLGQIRILVIGLGDPVAAAVR